MGINNRDYTKKNNKKWQDSYYTPKIFRARQYCPSFEQTSLNTSRWKIFIIFSVATAVAALVANHVAGTKPTLPFPVSGHTVWYSKIPKQVPTNFKIKTPSSPATNYEVTLENWYTKDQTVSIYIRNGDTASIAVPLGSYKIKVRSGSQWFGYEKKFGDFSRAVEAVHPIKFAQQGGTSIGHTISLEEITNGNLQMQPSR